MFVAAGDDRNEAESLYDLAYIAGAQKNLPLAEQRFAAPEVLRGPVGETNQLALHGRGVFVCISP